MFIGDVGRPDLRAALGWSATELAGMLFDSLHNKLLALPDQSLVCPAHGAGSLCGRAIGEETVSTLGEQRRANYAVQPMGKEAFIKLVTSDQPDAPPYFNYDALRNSEEMPTLDVALEHQMTPLTLDDVLALQAAGAQILDTRAAGEFSAGHLAGSVNIGLEGQYATWAGTILDPTHPIVLIGEAERVQESIIRLGRIGFDNVAGYLRGGLHSLKAHPELIVFTERLSPQLASERLSSNQPPVLIDVRPPREREKIHIDGSLSIPLNRLAENPTNLPRNRALLVYCAGGYRSSIAASLLQASGFPPVGEIAGGLAAWQEAKLPVHSAKHGNRCHLTEDGRQGQ